MFRVNIDPGIGNLESHRAADSLPVEIRERTVDITRISICSRRRILIKVLGRTVSQFPAVMESKISLVRRIIQGQRMGIRIPGITRRISLLACAVVNIGLFDLFPDVVIGIAVGGFPLDLNVLIAEVVIGFAFEGIFDCIIAVIVDGRLVFTGSFTNSLEIQVFCYRRVEIICLSIKLPFSEHNSADRRVSRFCRFSVLLDLLSVCNIAAAILEINIVKDCILSRQRNGLCNRQIEIIRYPIQGPCAEFLPGIIPYRDLRGLGHFMAGSNIDLALFI